MKNFSNLNDAERKLFLSVVAPQNLDTQKKAQKSAKRKRKPLLPAEWSVEALYKKLVDNHDSKVERRLKRIEAKKVKEKTLQKQNKKG